MIAICHPKINATTQASANPVIVLQKYPSGKSIAWNVGIVRNHKRIAQIYPSGISCVSC